MVIQHGEEPDPAKRIRQRQGKAIRNTRELKQISTETLAEAVGVTSGAIRHWETGRYTPKAHHQVKIAQALNVPWGLLFGLDGVAA